MRLSRKGAPALAVLALTMLASGAARAQTTADQVVDNESLKAFVEGVKAYIEAITDINEGARLREALRTEGDWKSGSIFLIIFLKSGEPFIHGNDHTAESKNLLAVEDDRGTRVVEELFAAAARGGGFVEYYDGEPRTAYAIEYTSGITARQFVLVGGYSQDVSHVPIQIADLPRPAVTASQVVDRETLITFVEEAARVYREAVLSEGYSALTGIRNAFREEGGDWKSGSIYLYVVSAGGIILFHGTEPFREGRSTDLTRTDINGVRFAEELLGGARREGRKFLQYHYDDPTVEGDEDTGSPKLGYAVSFEVPNSDQKAVIGSGIYLGVDARIVKDDHLQTMWLSRFGRTVGSQLTEAVSGRLGADFAPGATATLVGQSLDLSRADDGGALAAAITGLARAFGAPGSLASENDPFARHGLVEAWSDPAATITARSLKGHELLLGSSFHVAGTGEGSGPVLAAWGRVGHGSFDGDETDRNGLMGIDGEVVTGTLGADADWDSALAGVAVSLSEGEGGFASPAVDRGKSGRIESTLTTVSPYARIRLTERVSAWGLAGWGTGDMTIRFDDKGMDPIRTDIGMRMGAMGARGEVLEQDETGGMDLALKADAFVVRMDSEKAPNSAETEADASRVRLALEGGRRFDLPGGASLRPSLEVGVRHDGGDAETGTGVEIGGTVRYADTMSGLSIEAKTRMLVAHADSDYEEWGASATALLDPGTAGRGLSFSLSPTLGASSSASERLWDTRDALGLAPGTDGFEASRGLRAEIGYSLGLFGHRFTGTPNLGFGISDGGARDWRIGWRLTSAAPGDPAFEVSFDATRRERTDGPGSEPGGGKTEHGAMLRSLIRW